MEIFDEENGLVVIHPAAKTLKPFKKLINRDKSKDKAYALEDLAFVYFFTDYKSDFSDILDDNIRSEEVKKVCITRDKWTLDSDIQAAIDFYHERQQTTSSKLLDSANEAIGKIEKYFKDIDLDQKDDKGKPIHDVNKILASVNNLSKTVQSLKDLEEIVRREKEEESRIRGGEGIGDYEE